MVEQEPSSDNAADLVAENEELKRQLEGATAAARTERSHRWRRALAVVLAVLAILATVAAVDALWLKMTLQDEDNFVATFRALPQDQAVAGAISVRVVEGVVEATGVGDYVAASLPPELDFAVAPITESIRDVVAQNAVAVVSSDAVATAWAGALRVTHRAASAVISGNDAALVAESGQVTIDLNEIADAVLDRVQAAGIPLPDTETDIEPIVIYEDEQLASAQVVAEGVDTMGWLLPFIALFLIGMALWASPDRRWMIAFLGFGTAFGLLIGLVVVRVSRNAMLAAIEDPVSHDAAAAVWDTTVNWLVAVSWGLLVLALIIGFAAWAFGPSQKAQRFSVWASNTIDRWRRPAEDDPSGFTAFLAEWKRTIQVLVVVFGLLFLLFGPPMTGLRVVLVTVIVLAIVVLVEVFAGPTLQPMESTADGSELVDS